MWLTWCRYPLQVAAAAERSDRPQVTPYAYINLYIYIYTHIYIYIYIYYRYKAGLQGGTGTFVVPL